MSTLDLARRYIQKCARTGLGEHARKIQEARSAWLQGQPQWSTVNLEWGVVYAMRDAADALDALAVACAP